MKIAGAKAPAPGADALASLVLVLFAVAIFMANIPSANTIASMPLPLAPLKIRSLCALTHGVTE